MVVMMFGGGVFYIGTVSEVKVARCRAGLTQKEVAEKCHMSLSSIGKIEKGDTDFITFGKMKLISKVLNCSVQELFLAESSDNDLLS